MAPGAPTPDRSSVVHTLDNAVVAGLPDEPALKTWGCLDGSPTIAAAPVGDRGQPWVQNVDEQRFLGTFRLLPDRDPDLVLSTHLPPAPGITGPMIDTLGSAAGSAPFEGPDQAALKQMLAGFEPA
ncbi:hypothetical protein KCMC57_up61930 [Kitasatospora sp. CMC57]|uniref:Uncharacterized protein n=1 Tax=Kitasatospora sp. CMC57 TaxID=3231513 RepID=A0AB33K7F7_9ACTN